MEINSIVVVYVSCPTYRQDRVNTNLLTSICRQMAAWVADSCTIPFWRFHARGKVPCQSFSFTLIIGSWYGSCPLVYSRSPSRSIVSLHDSQFGNWLKEAIWRVTLLLSIQYLYLLMRPLENILKRNNQKKSRSCMQCGVPDSVIIECKAF